MASVDYCGKSGFGLGVFRCIGELLIIILTRPDNDIGTNIVKHEPSHMDCIRLRESADRQHIDAVQT